MKLLAALACMLLAGRVTAAPCNKMAALEVQTMISEFAKTQVGRDIVTVTWTSKMDKESEEKLLAMTKGYADMDACLSGEPREIHFYRKAKLVGVASPTSGIRLVK
ncbi:hypothetical protein [Massilia pseudoviolaceinigra]|uniref:hypothetical protein n=1 Tax=Massilia pseudoviolaceinigra TaxID=3057165 RepID=UPI0027964B77|nr:hypothetical protein [Massilia sp. CCM 9206]MDQ1921682.1 hypothetical protein [Massilia sp. CCM 9206]